MRRIYEALLRFMARVVTVFFIVLGAALCWLDGEDFFGKDKRP